jgi:hypothetical protein
MSGLCVGMALLRVVTYFLTLLILVLPCSESGVQLRDKNKENWRKDFVARSHQRTYQFAETSSRGGRPSPAFWTSTAIRAVARRRVQ